MMIARKFVFLLLLLIVSYPSLSQIKFIKTEHNFGVLEEWSSEPAEFEFINSGESAFEIIHAKKAREVRVMFPRGDIQPNQKGTFSVYYDPYKIGSFYEKILVYTSLSAKPVTLVIRGKIKSLINCPKINQQSNDIDLSYFQDGLVVDSKTKIPIGKAVVHLKNIDGSSFTKTSKEGKFRKQIKLGVYTFKIEAEGYHPHEESIYLKKNSPTLYFELDPLELVSIENPETNIELKSEPSHVIEETPVIVEQPFKPTPEEIKTEEVEIIPEDPKKETEYTFESSYEEKDSLIIEAEPIKPGKPVIEEFIPEPEIEKEETTKKEEVVPEEKIQNRFGQDITIKPAEFLPRHLYSANNIVFLIDVSSSMNKQNKLSLLKSSMTHLTKILRDIDLVTLIIYSTKQKVLLTSVSADQKNKIIPVIDSLSAKGFTFGIRGLNKAYEIATQNYIPDGNNQIIVATDGEFNSPDHSEVELISMINKQAREGTIISVIGFGENTEAIRRMKRMARFGKGNYLHISDVQTASSILIDEIKLNSKKE